MRQKNLITLFSVILSLTVFSCEEFGPIDSEISKFDEGSACGLLDNQHTALLDTMNLLVAERADSAWVDSYIDSIIENSSGDSEFFDTLSEGDHEYIPTGMKTFCSTEEGYGSGYVILNLENVNIDNKKWVLYFNNYIKVTIWDSERNRMDVDYEGFPWEVVARSISAKARYEYLLSNEKYILRLTKSEMAREQGVVSFYALILSEEFQVSESAESVCDILDNIKDYVELIPQTLLDVDSTWGDKKIQNILSVDSNRNKLVEALENNDLLLSTEHEGMNIRLKREFGKENLYFILDLREESSVDKWSFYITRFVDINLWSITSGEEIVEEEKGVTFRETGACPRIKQKFSYCLESDIYLIELEKLQTGEFIYSFNIVYLKEN
jgi:hypothetical protein